MGNLDRENERDNLPVERRSLKKSYFTKGLYKFKEAVHQSLK